MFGSILKRLIPIAALIAVVACPTTGFSEEIDQTIKIVSDEWSVLEVIKLAISLLTPAAMIYVGLWMDRRIKEFEHRQWSNQKVIEKRLEVYELITPQLNDLMCYFLRIGTWKERDPTEIVDIKRETDKVAHIYAPLFSPEFLQRYNEFIATCFATFRGAGLDAQLRVECEHYRDAYSGDENDQGEWQPEWDDCFTPKEEASSKDEVRRGYQELVNLIARELGVGLQVSQNA